MLRYIFLLFLFAKSMKHDWKLLTLLLERNDEETSIIIHDCITKITKITFEEACQTKERRSALEEKFCQAAIGGMRSECFEGKLLFIVCPFSSL